ncbi:hypothetical protein V494_02473 [Pseudogymnoascus sp. VKM F-4513 (FW-928)]|nr:hypothetical protein V494_02473 [Pseudogymnoascus sp. VKM F-4513 (FW-928)]
MEYESIPKYAILSHTWGEDEVTYKDIVKRPQEAARGYRKIKDCALQHLKTVSVTFRLTHAVSTKPAVQSCPSQLIPCFGGIVMPTYATPTYLTPQNAFQTLIIGRGYQNFKHRVGLLGAGPYRNSLRPAAVFTFQPVGVFGSGMKITVDAGKPWKSVLGVDKNWSVSPVVSDFRHKIHCRRPRQPVIEVIAERGVFDGKVKIMLSVVALRNADSPWRRAKGILSAT